MKQEIKKMEEIIFEYRDLFKENDYILLNEYLKNLYHNEQTVERRLKLCEYFEWFMFYFYINLCSFWFFILQISFLKDYI
jgi:hypothetical protein